MTSAPPWQGTYSSSEHEQTRVMQVGWAITEATGLATEHAEQAAKAAVDSLEAAGWLRTEKERGDRA